MPFQRQYHRVPSPQAIFGYEAMAAVLAVLREDGGVANDRSKVARDFFAIRNRQSVLGTYSLNANGDTSLTDYGAYGVKNGSDFFLKTIHAAS